ncbi:fasciclin-like arabinogalactan protein 2 [Nicotiana tabacum]|uniref:Fasciclin-like arabinogalactan protein 2 n=2 Tax=Nicotiana TaxID=4085 RepID=A0A1S4CJJ6_TOBAC|nr:PREDICTED: fasciclin-like arabinogalactan protein 2 [Nicotiana sylvestris]
MHLRFFFYSFLQNLHRLNYEIKMQHSLPMFSLSLLFLLFLSTTTTSSAHNITQILAKHHEFSTFNRYLTLTHLASEINRRQTITVCAVDNAAMDDLLDKHLSIYTLKNVLSLHVFADYFSSKKLHKITNGTTLTATLFQATGEAPGTSGYINITNTKGKNVGFTTEENDGHFSASFVKSVQEIPYNISVIQISNIIQSSEAEAPVSAPAEIDIIDLMTNKGCKEFAKLLEKSNITKTFTDIMENGLTVFCPIDKVVNTFLPKYKNLTKNGQTSLLLYHGIPDYHSLGMLRSKNGFINTMATTKGKNNKYDFSVKNDGDNVKLDTNIVTAKITGTLLDEEPLAVYKIDKVLQPSELFKAQSIFNNNSEDTAPEPNSGDDDGDVPADATADNNGVMIIGVNGWLMTLILSIGLVFV